MTEDQEPTITDLEKTFSQIIEKARVDDDNTRTSVYNFIHVFFAILLAVKDNAPNGWAAELTLPDGSLAFDANQAAEVEKLVEGARPNIEELLGTDGFSQTGGGLLDKAKGKLGGSPAGMAGDIITYAGKFVDPDKISLDAIYTNITNYLDELDLQNRQIARMIGPVAFTSQLKTDPFIPNPLFAAFGLPPAKFQIPARSILPFLNAVIEIIRIAIALSPTQFPMVRKFMSISLAVLDVFSGEWKNGILSLLGVIGNKPMFIGIFLKVLRDAFMLIEPQLAKRLRTDVYKAGKSMAVGLILRIFSTFAPDFIRNPLEAGVGRFRSLVDTVNERIGMFQDQANSAAGPLGVEVRFPMIPTDLIPSFDDIQSLQTIMQQPELYCNTNIRAVLEPMRDIPPLRFILEMLNIPFVPELIADSCKNVDTDNLSSALAAKLDPQILVDGIPLTGEPVKGEPYPPKEQMVKNGMKNVEKVADKKGIRGLADLTRGGHAAMPALTAKTDD
jgi:hypothetical protein